MLAVTVTSPGLGLTLSLVIEFYLLTGDTFRVRSGDIQENISLFHVYRSELLVKWK